MDAERYLTRIGATRDDDLSTLVTKHIATVPFENLSIHLGETISLEPSDLLDKIVERRRGGFCHELNGGFRWLLTELGHDAELLGGRVHEPSGETTQPLTHAALRVIDDGRPWLVDVGFGRIGVWPTALDPPDPARLRPTADGDIELLQDDGKAAYRLEPRVRQHADFVPTCYWQATSPASWFTHGTLCSLPLADGRATLTGQHLIRTAADGTRHEQDLDADETLAAYRDLFGIELDRLPVALHPPAS